MLNKIALDIAFNLLKVIHMFLNNAFFLSIQVKVILRKLHIFLIADENLGRPVYDYKLQPRPQ